MQKTTIDEVLLEHAPRGNDDPLYVPWWAKGEYARANGTKYRLEDGTVIEGGRIVVRGTGSPRSASKPEPVLTPQPPAARVSETPSRASRTPRKPARTPDLVDELLQMNRSRESRLVLCRAYGVDPAILDNAPNPGVASMRLANALRAKLQGK